MKPFETIRSRAIALSLANCDTDQIVPGRFLSRKRSEGFGGQLFHDLRYENGQERVGFALNRPEWRGAELLIAGANFGCGSSRESAVWALVDSGIRAVIAPSFGDIFYGNAFKNGLLPIQLLPTQVDTLLQTAATRPDTLFEVDLASQTLRQQGGDECRFAVDALGKNMLLHGMDEITFTRTYLPAIVEFESAYDEAQPWLAPPAA
jgi:3-isopropylmalate/(R)-2-methylmalate dehydratase small subunit